MQYLLTQEELDAIKATADVDKKVEERVARIAKAVEAVLWNYGVTRDTVTFEARRLLADLREAFQTK
jgi:hypothetical protein